MTGKDSMAFLPRAERERIARLRTLAIPAAVPVQAAWGRAQDIRSSRLASSPRPITTRLKGIALVAACVLAFGTQTVASAPTGARVGSIASIARMSAGRPRGIRPGRDVRIGTHLVGFDDGLTGAGFGLAGGLVGTGLQALAPGPFASPLPPFIGVPNAAPPCLRPQIIRIGEGPRRRAGVRVVYGTPPSCGS